MEIFPGQSSWRWKKRWRELAQRLGVQRDERKTVRDHDSKVRSIFYYVEGLKRETVMVLEGRYRDYSIVLEAYKTYPSDPRALKIEHHFSKFSVQIGKLTDLSMSVSQKGFLGKVVVKFGGQDIKLDNREFDKKYMVKGDNEELIRNILDPVIQSRIMGVKHFETIVIDNDEASFEIKGFTKYIDRLQSMIDVTIDIVEKIESLA